LSVGGSYRYRVELAARGCWGDQVWLILVSRMASFLECVLPDEIVFFVSDMSDTIWDSSPFIIFALCISCRQASVSLRSWQLKAHWYRISKVLLACFCTVFYGRGSESFLYGFAQLIFFKKSFYHYVGTQYYLFSDKKWRTPL